MRSLISTFLFVFLALRVMSGDLQQIQSDADFRQKIVGTWIIHVGTTNEATWARGTETYNSNGSFVVEVTVGDHGKAQLEKYYGSWQITNSILIAANTNVAAIKAGKLGRNYENCKLIHIDEYVMVHYLYNKPIKNPSRPDIVVRRRLE